MNKDVCEIMVEKTRALMNASTCCDAVKEAAQNWLDAIGSDQEANVSETYFKVLEENIVPIDELIALAKSEDGIHYFGAETAKKIEEHAESIKANGASFCDCPACALVAEILALKEKA